MWWMLLQKMIIYYFQLFSDLNLWSCFLKKTDRNPNPINKMKFEDHQRKKSPVSSFAKKKKEEQQLW
jgi:hypothetical protein